MVAIAESISNFKHRDRPQRRRHRVCYAENPRFCSFSRLFVDRCSLTVDEGQDPAGYPGAAAHPRPGASAGFRGADAEHNCGEHCSPPLNINGANTYQLVMSTPVNGTDPLGLWHWYEPWTWNWSWLPWAAKAAVKVAPHVVLKEGATECELPKAAPGVLTVALQHKLNRAKERRMNYDFRNEITQDNVYNALNNFDNGFPLTPSQQQIVAQWLHGDLNLSSPGGQ